MRLTCVAALVRHFLFLLLAHQGHSYPVRGIFCLMDIPQNNPQYVHLAFIQSSLLNATTCPFSIIATLFFFSYMSKQSWIVIISLFKCLSTPFNRLFSGFLVQLLLFLGTVLGMQLAQNNVRCPLQYLHRFLSTPYVIIMDSYGRAINIPFFYYCHYLITS